MGSRSLLQGVFPTQGLNRGLPDFRQIPSQLSPQGSPRILQQVAYSFSSGCPDPGIELGSPAAQWGRILFQSSPLASISLLETLVTLWLVEVSPWSLSSSSPGILPVCVCMCVCVCICVHISLFNTGTNQMGVAPTILTTSSLIISAKTLFPNQATFWGIGG